MASNSTDDDTDIESFCKSILYSKFESVSVRKWDVLILVPNLCFLVFLCVRFFQRARLKLYATNSPVFLGFYGQIWICAIFSVLRCVISMSMSSLHIDPYTEDVTNKVLWTILRFVVLTAEISVLIFSLAFGRMESSHSIRAVLCTTGTISLVFSVIQGALELLLSTDQGVFSHGGVYFLLVTSVLFLFIYTAVYVLPYTRISNVILFPVKPSFYRYILALFGYCLCVTAGCVLLLTSLPFNQDGYCFINFAHFAYFTSFIPLVYLSFLRNYGHNSTRIPFSYTMNESMYEDNVNSIESVNTLQDEDEANGGCSGGPMPGSSSQGDLLSNSNRFVLNGPVNGGGSPDQVNYHQFLYNTNIQSPTGYSSVEDSATATAHGSMEFIQHGK